MDETDREIDANYDFFQRNLASYLSDHAGQIALLRRCAVIGFYDDVGAAARAADAQFSDGVYSLQPVIETPVDLGFFSHVGG